VFSRERWKLAPCQCAKSISGKHSSGVTYLCGTRDASRYRKLGHRWRSSRCSSGCSWPDRRSRVATLLRERDREQMIVAMPRSSFGGHVFGLAALAFGVITPAWHDYRDAHQLRYLVPAASATLIVGGAAIQFARTGKTGSAVLVAAYLVFALLCVPGIIAAPRIYNSWGNFFEQFSLLTGAAIAYARWSWAWSPETLKRSGGVLLGLCAASFTLEQAFYLEATAGLVPQWVPRNPMFGAVATTVFLESRPWLC
jgi:hypothetical protein